MSQCIDELPEMIEWVKGKKRILTMEESAKFIEVAIHVEKQKNRLVNY